MVEAAILQCLAFQFPKANRWHSSLTHNIILAGKTGTRPTPHPQKNQRRSIEPHNRRRSSFQPGPTHHPMWCPTVPLAELGYDEEWIVQRTGIRSRRHAEPGVATSELAVKAAQSCLDTAGVRAVKST